MITLTDEMLEAIKIIEGSNQSLYITGKAGTGKTTFLKYIVTNIKKRFIITASTGIAAINAGGVTLHSLFNIPLEVITEKSKTRVSFRRAKVEIFQALDSLIIDEISMVRPDVLDFIDRTLKMYRGNNEPFGGVQLIMFGDLFQLPPVVKKDEGEVLLQYYNGVYFYYSKALIDSGFKIIELTHVFRQSDPKFIKILNDIREYNITPEDIEELEELRDKKMADNYDNEYVHLCCFRKDAQRINSEMLGVPSHSYQATISNDFPLSSAPCDQELKLRVGARVMMLVNDSTHLYYNGSLGVVAELREDAIIVSLDEGQKVEVHRTKWTNKEYKMVDGKLSTIEKGYCEQFPVTLAWAITIHKSQGLTLPHVILHTSYTFAPGQLYVALSRCTSLNNIVSTSFIGKKHILIDQDLLDFNKACKLNNNIFNRETYKIMEQI